MTYEVIIFDIDDTLFDFKPSQTEALHNTFVAFGLPKGLQDYEASYNEISAGLWQELEQGTITLAALGVERFRRLFVAHGLDIDADLFSDTYLEHLGKQTHLIPGATEVCERLSHYRLAVITNSFTHVQQARIANSPLSHTFEHVIISEEVGYSKPRKEIFDYAFDQLRVTDLSKVLMVGDSLTSDIQGGIHSNIDTCWFNPQRKVNNRGIQPTYEIGALTDLIPIVEHRSD